MTNSAAERLGYRGRRVSVGRRPGVALAVLLGLVTPTARTIGSDTSGTLDAVPPQAGLDFDGVNWIDPTARTSRSRAARPAGTTVPAPRVTADAPHHPDRMTVRYPDPSYSAQMPPLAIPWDPPPTVDRTPRWSGFLQLDTGWLSQDAASAEAIGGVDSKAGLRRVRLRLDGDLSVSSTYTVDLDFAAAGHPSFRDVVLRFHDVNLLQNLQLGYFQQPFGLDAMSSGRDLIFIERGLAFAFAPFRQTGIEAHGTAASERVGWAVSAFAFPTDAFGVGVGDGGIQTTATRVVVRPVDRPDRNVLVHLGLGYSFGMPSNQTVRYRIQPGFFVNDPADRTGARSFPVFVDTGLIPAHNFHLYGAELAGQIGSFLVQAEASLSAVEQIDGPYLVFSGASVAAAWVLTGEARDYDRTRGVFHRVARPDHRSSARYWGALELACGWSYINLNDRNVHGGQLSTVVAGVNWYLTRHAMIKCNLIHAILDDPVFGRGRSDIAAVRVQVEF